MTANGFPRWPVSTRPTSRTLGLPMRSTRWFGGHGGRRSEPQSPKMAFSTSPIPGACSTRSMGGRAPLAGSSGGWTRSRKNRHVNRGAALWRNLVISPGQLAGAHRCHRQRDRQGGVGNQRGVRRSRSRITGGAAADQGQDHRRRVGWRPRRARLDRRRSMLRPARCFGASSPFRLQASPAAKPGRAITTPGKPAAAPCG